MEMKVTGHIPSAAGSTLTLKLIRDCMEGFEVINMIKFISHFKYNTSPPESQAVYFAVYGLRPGMKGYTRF